MELDSQRIDIPCPGCGHKTQQQIGRLKGQMQITCPHCHQPFGLGAKQFAKSIEEVRRAEAALAETIKRLGKR